MLEERLCERRRIWTLRRPFGSIRLACKVSGSRFRLLHTVPTSDAHAGAYWADTTLYVPVQACMIDPSVGIPALARGHVLDQRVRFDTGDACFKCSAQLLSQAIQSDNFLGHGFLRLTRCGNQSLAMAGYALSR
jgi:hypothetical protein